VENIDPGIGDRIDLQISVDLARQEIRAMRRGAGTWP